MITLLATAALFAGCTSSQVLRDPAVREVVTTAAKLAAIDAGVPPAVVNSEHVDEIILALGDDFTIEGLQASNVVAALAPIALEYLTNSTVDQSEAAIVGTNGPAFVPGDIPATGRNLLYQKFHYDSTEHTFGDVTFQPSWRIKVTVPEYFAEAVESVAELKLTFSNEATAETVGPYETHRGEFTDSGKPQFQLRSRLPESGGSGTNPNWQPLISGPLWLTLSDGGRVLMRVQVANPQSSYNGPLKETM